MTFDALGLEPGILSAIADAGYETPTPIQQEAIPRVSRVVMLLDRLRLSQARQRRRSLCHRYSCWAGASWAAPLFSVLGPTRELAAQVKEQFEKYGKASPLKCTLIHGGVGC